jgi:hypothetical protein
MKLTSGEAIWCFSLRFDDLHSFFDQFIKKNPSTQRIEEQALGLVASNFEFSKLKDFVREVCRWGGYAGVAGRVIKNNQKEVLESTFKTAYHHAVEKKNIEAIRTLTGLHGLAISFASKHLKFLVPTNAVVLDSIISKRLAYDLSPEGYVKLLNDCADIAKHANEAKVQYPGWAGRWRASDIEMAIFEKLGERYRSNS